MISAPLFRIGERQNFSERGSGADAVCLKIDEVSMPAAIPILTYNNPPEVKLNEEFRLKAGQEVYFEEENLRISFVSVITDTRSAGINSVVTGNAEILLIVSESGIETEACLSTGREPKSVELKNYRIILKTLFPYPSDSRIIFHSRYTAALIVRRKNKIFS